MTNKEKFEQVFGFIPYAEGCSIIPKIVCDSIFDMNECDNCPFTNWWDKEYKPCFKLDEEKLKEGKK